jgi:hypothetical protein
MTSPLFQLQRYLLWAFVALFALVAILSVVFTLLSPEPRQAGMVGISQVLADAQAQRIASIEIGYDDPQELSVTYRDQPDLRYSSRVEAGRSILDLLATTQVPLDSLDVYVARRPPGRDMGSILSILVPTFGIIGGTIALSLFSLRRQRALLRQTVPPSGK